MKQNNISGLSRLDRECYENLFNVYQTKDGMYFYNIIQSIVFPEKLPASLFDFYTITREDTWPLISYKNYKTPNLWWILMYANNILDPTKPLKVGEEIKVPILPVVEEVLTQIAK
jgi:LysM repeat protein